MKKNVLVNFRIEEDLKNDFVSLVEEKGYTMSDIITASIEEMVRMNRIPLNILSFANRRYVKNILTIPDIKRAIVDAIVFNNLTGIKSIALFGSYSRGEATTKSDIDLLVELVDKNETDDGTKLETDLIERTGKEIQITYKDTLNDYFLHVINKDKIVLYEQE